MARLSGACVGFLLLMLVALRASAASPKRVLILDPFERDVAPFSASASAFRTTLARELGEPVDFYEIPLDLARFTEPEGEGPLVTFMEGRIKSRRVDLVVTIGAAGMQFAARHRERLFRDTPILAVAADPRLLPSGFLRTNATFVTQKINLPGMVEDILQLQPQTTNIAVVFGSSALEKFWVNECRREFQPFTNRVGFTWLNDLPLEQVLKRCTTLPPHSFILHGLFVVDAAGVPCEKNDVLRRLHETANAPLFGFFASELGLGAIGGRLYRDSEVGEQGGRTAIRILRGEKPERIPPQVFEAAAPVYDWRELQRWGVSEARLPVGSVIQFRQPGFWELYRLRIVGVIVFCCLQTLLIVGLVTNALARKRADQNLRESEERLTLAAEAAEFGVWVWNVTSNQIWGSETWRRLFGFAAGEDIGFEKLFQKIHPDDREAMEQEIKCAAAGQTDHLREYRIILPDGTLRWIASRGRMQAAAMGAAFRMFGVAVEITERKQAEAELRQQRAELAHVARVSTMGELAASVAHELNQPLGAILANAEAAELFLEQKPPALDELRATLADIRKDDERASQVIRRMRALLRKRELELLPIEINSLVEEVLQLVSGDAALRRVSLNADLLPFLPKIAGDRVHLQQVLLNLIINGMDAMNGQPRERRQIQVRTRFGDDGRLELAVVDSGHGIEPDKLPRLFEAFYTTKPNGMGMGLSIARTIIDAHHGRIWAENNATGGAVFRITLPALARQQLGDKAK